MRPIPLASGEWFFPNDPDPDKITIPLIARALSNLCRYTGHTAGFYSVAQHSWHVSQLLARNGHPEWVLEGLLHDAAETFVNDLSAPMKETMPNYQAIEDGIIAVIWNKFGLDDSDLCWSAIKQADRDSYATEVRDLFPPMNPEIEWTFYGPHEPDANKLSSWSPPYAEHRFLEFYEGVIRDRGTEGWSEVGVQ
jgi:hypothetical protein